MTLGELVAGDRILPCSELQSQTPLPDLVLAGHLQRRSDGNPSAHPHIHVVKDAFAKPPGDLVRDLAPSADLGDGKGSEWYVISGTKWQPSADGRSSSTAKRDLRVGDGKTLWHPETGITPILGQDNNPVPVEAYKRTLSYISSKKNQQPEDRKSSKKKRLGWSMVEIGLERDMGADHQLVLCKLHRTKPKTRATSMEASSTTGAEAPRVEERLISGDDQMHVQAAEADVDPVAGRCGISGANTDDDQQGRAEAGEEASVSLDGAELGTLCRPRGENPNRARGLGCGNAATIKKAVVDEPRSGLTVVMKFGGSSINSAERIKEMAKLVIGFPARAGARRGEIPVVVLSAMGDTATNILHAAEKAVSCGEQQVCEIVELADIKELHIRTIAELGVDIVRPAISDLLDQLEKNLEYVAVEKGLTPTAIWRLVSLGESMATTIFSAYLNERGEKSRKYDAHAFSVMTTDNSSTMDILQTTYPAVAKKLLGDWIDGPAIPVVPCFAREACKPGDITPLGSDLTAMIVGKALGSGEIQIWEDAEGVLTGDPNICTDAIPVHKLTFDEAIVLAYSGHPGLHPQSMLFAIKGGLPIVTIKSTSNPEAPGTTITQTRDMSKTILSSIVLKSNIFLLNIENTRLLSLCDFKAQVYSIFKRSDICVDCEATSGGQMSLTLHPSKLCGSKLTQREVLNVIEELEKVATVARPHQSIISLVGNVQKSSFILEKASNTLGRFGVNAQNVWQTSSKVLNVSLVIHANEAEQCLKALHSAFLEAGCFLSKVEGTEASASPGDKRKADGHDHLHTRPAVLQRTDTDRSRVVEETESTAYHRKAGNPTKLFEYDDNAGVCEVLPEQQPPVLPEVPEVFQPQQVLAQVGEGGSGAPGVLENETEGSHHSMTDDRDLEDLCRRLRADDDWQTSFCMRQQWEDSDLDCPWDETEPQLFSNNNPGGDADGALKDFFNNIDDTNIEPVRVDARNAPIVEASHIALANIRRSLFSEEELMHDGDDNGGDPDRYLAGILDGDANLEDARNLPVGGGEQFMPPSAATEADAGQVFCSDVISAQVAPSQSGDELLPMQEWDPDGNDS